MPQEIYYDNSATTRTRDESAALITELLTQNYGNPSSLHRKGFAAQQKMDLARKQIADSLGCSSAEIFFTSGGTESDNLAILGVAEAQKRRGNKIVTTAFEHDAVRHAVQHLEEQGFEICRLIPDNHGQITPEQVADAIDGNTILLSIMAVNNEIGSILPIPALCRAARRKNENLLIHCDAVQAYCKEPIKLGKNFDVDFLSVSGHKIYAPKGVGALYARRSTRIRPLLFGGGQERGLRPGTEAIANICAMGCSAQLLLAEREEVTQRVRAIHQALREGMEKMPTVRMNSDPNGTPFIMNLSVLGIRSEIMLHFLEEKQIYVSSGSACARGESSHVLQAIGLEKARADSALRLSFGRYNTLDQVPVFLAALEEGLARWL